MNFTYKPVKLLLLESNSTTYNQLNIYYITNLSYLKLKLILIRPIYSFTKYYIKIPKTNKVIHEPIIFSILATS